MNPPRPGSIYWNYPLSARNVRLRGPALPTAAELLPRRPARPGPGTVEHDRPRLQTRSHGPTRPRRKAARPATQAGLSRAAGRGSAQPPEAPPAFRDRRSAVRARGLPPTAARVHAASRRPRRRALHLASGRPAGRGPAPGLGLQPSPATDETRTPPPRSGIREAARSRAPEARSVT